MLIYFLKRTCSASSFKNCINIGNGENKRKYFVRIPKELYIKVDENYVSQQE
jgi:hypothetical protein